MGGGGKRPVMDCGGGKTPGGGFGPILPALFAQKLSERDRKLTCSPQRAWDLARVKFYFQKYCRTPFFLFLLCYPLR